MKKKGKNKKVKGMTLIEIIVAIFIFGAASTILVQGVATIFYNNRASRNIVDKVLNEAPVAENKSVTTVVTDDDGTDVEVELSKEIDDSESEDPFGISISAESFPDVTMILPVKQYEVIDPEEDDEDSEPESIDGGNFKFFMCE